jgi:hypothetical protein
VWLFEKLSSSAFHLWTIIGIYRISDSLKLAFCRWFCTNFIRTSDFCVSWRNFSGYSSMKMFFVNTLETVSGLTFFCKWFYISAVSFVVFNFGLSQNPSFVIRCKIFVVPILTLLVSLFRFHASRNVLNSRMASVDDYGNFLQRLSVFKIITTAISSLLYEHL